MSSSSIDVSMIRDDFWKYTEIWLTKPGIYNKNLGAVSIFVSGPNEDRIKDLNSTYQCNRELINSYDDLAAIIKLSNDVAKKGIFDKIFISEGVLCCTLTRILYHKRGHFLKNCLELVLCDFQSSCIKFIRPLLQDEEKGYYSIAHQESCIRLASNYCTMEIENIFDKFRKKVCLWSTIGINKTQFHSLNLVPSDSYVMLYNRLKNKYSEPIKKIWTESTDFDKSFHQAVSIATYLLLLWGEKQKSFVDIGCGSGLLVHILNSEQHSGRGIDVRSRKIWSKYPNTTYLTVKVFTPNDHCLFPETDWIIGNHSDELTPWIPVIAAKSSYEANFFLLPCCPYDFSGKKFERRNAQISQYADYLNYIEDICNLCGFQTKRDRLRIPSTKRICFVGLGRTHNVDDIDKIRKNIISFINYSNKSIETNSADWIPNFKPRSAVEKVKNCSHIDKDLLNAVVTLIASMILETSSNKTWNDGCFISINKIAQRLPPEILSRLKSECGGLQTLLRNQHFVFLTQNGAVKFRIPVAKIDPFKWKEKPCWFYYNHPQSCPLDDKDCSFIH